MLDTNNACLLWCHLGMRQDVDGRATKASDSGSSACCPRAVYFLLILFNTKELQSAVTPTNSERERERFLLCRCIWWTRRKGLLSPPGLQDVQEKPMEVHRFRLLLMLRGCERFTIGSANPLNQTQLLWIYGIVSSFSQDPIFSLVASAHLLSIFFISSIFLVFP